MALPAPFVFGTISLAIVVLPEEVTSARTLSAGYAGLMTILAFAAGIGVQPAARRLTAPRPRAGIIAGLAAAVAGAAIGAAAVAGPNEALAGVAAVFLGLAYGLCLVNGLHDAEQLAGPRDRGTVLAVYYVLAYLGFGAPYAVDGLNQAFGKPGTFAVARRHRGGGRRADVGAGRTVGDAARALRYRTESAYFRTADQPAGGPAGGRRLRMVRNF